MAKRTASKSRPSDYISLSPGAASGLRSGRVVADAYRTVARSTTTGVSVTSNWCKGFWLGLRYK